MSLDAYIDSQSTSDNPQSFHGFDPNAHRNAWNTPWTARGDDMLRKMWREGVIVREIAGRLCAEFGYHFSMPATERRAALLGLPRRCLTVWTDESKAYLTELWANPEIQLKSIPDRINQRFGTSFTRNACIGRANRMGLPDRPNRVNQPLTPEKMEERRLARLESKRKWDRENRSKRSQTSAPRTPRLLHIVKTIEMPVEQRKTLMQLGAMHCHYPVGHPTDADFFFCGADLPADHDMKRPPYCPGHAAICFRRR